ncbi:hypothetical protein [Xenorhabdus budapestensis]|uniref:hypothetical protein n=1 Tax=Xenorhabdus budapestensis TaxID=290110 RepID=UPI000C0541E0|nr:hypothetical protein [Xenorhabdus budapestensis]
MNSGKNPDFNGYRQVNNKTKIHRHYVPKYAGGLPAIVPVRRLAGALKIHDWNRNTPLYKLRCKRNQRVSIRSERRETFSELALAMIAYADYNPDSEYLFEIMCSTEKLASLCGQLYHYDNGRKCYDPIRLALKDWEAADMIYIDRDRDPETRQCKAMRIWLRPAFFDGLGFSLAEIREIVTRFRRWMEKKGLRKDYQRVYAEHTLRLARSNVASLDNKHALKKLLLKVKRLVLGDDETLKKEKEHAINALEHRKNLIKATEPEPDENQVNRRIYENWSQKQPIAWRLAFEKEIQNLYPAFSGNELLRVYVKHLPDK